MSTQTKVLYPYKVLFNWHKELHTVYTHATTPKQAQRNAVQKLANKLGMSVGFVSKAVSEVNVVQLAAK